MRNNSAFVLSSVSGSIKRYGETFSLICRKESEAGVRTGVKSAFMDVIDLFNRASFVLHTKATTGGNA